MLAAAAGPAAAEPLLPNLTMAPLDDVAATLAEGGRERLRFSATIVNLGPGRFELRSVRPSRRAPWSVQQRVVDTDRPPQLVPTAARMTFGGDGHGHWHVRDLERYELRRVDGTTVPRRQRKAGFCFFDTSRVTGRSRPGARAARYSESRCRGRRARGLTTGLSPGWGDRYPFSLPDQFIDVTGLPVGLYRLVAIADDPGLFVEADETDNGTWVDIRLSRPAGIISAQVVARPDRGR